MTAVLGRGLVVAGLDQDLDEAVSRAAEPAGAEEPGPPADVPPPSPPAPGRLRRVWILPAAVVVAGALALLPGVGDGGPGPGEAEVRVDGSATVVGADGGTRVVTDASVRLGPGDTIEVTAGRARFTLDRDVAFEGRPGPAVAGRAGTTVEMGAVPELVAGPLLVVAPVPVAVRAAGSEIVVGPADGPGAARLDRRLGLGVGTYRGTVEVDSAGRAASVAPLHRVEVARPGALGRRDLPVEYSADDPWDRRFLADALLVDRQLGPLLGAFDASAGVDPATIEGLRRARPALPTGGLAELVAVAPTGSAALVTAVLADLGTGGSFPARADAIQRFRDDGAPWGLVTIDQGVAPDDLLTAVRSAIDRLGPDGVAVGAVPDSPDAAGAEDGPAGGSPASEAPIADDADGPGGGAPDDATGAGAGSGSGGGPGAGSPGGPVPSVPSVPVPPVTVPPSLPLPGGGPVGGVVDGAGETLGGVTDTVGEVVEDVTSGLGGVVDGLLDTAGRVLGAGEPAPPTGGGLLGLGG